MLAHRKLARDYLSKQDRDTFIDIIYKSKVTPLQKEILYMEFLDDKDHRFIGDTVGLTENRINHRFGEAYDVIYRYLKKNNILLTLL